jgi:hypothetical protein
MTPTLLREILGWCLIMNGALYLWWFLLLVCVRPRILTLHRRWFKMSDENFSSIHYLLLGLFKIGIFFFNVVPYLALRIAGV